MKQRMSVFVLILEIAAIAVLHTVKFTQESSIARTNKEMVESATSRHTVITTAKPTLFLTRLQ